MATPGSVGRIRKLHFLLRAACGCAPCTAGSSPRLAGSENIRRKVSDRAHNPSPAQAVRPRSAATTWFDDARRASSNHLLPSRKFERGRAGKGFQGAFQQVSLRRGRRACAQKVCQLFEPAQNACAECPRCDRVTGELRSRLAAEISLLINHALNVGMPSSREAVVQLASSRACRRTGQKAGGSCD
jgi:hypothetical protein